ncbi:phospholipase C OS=Streptomyces alboniger OX=132473 GN=CP975_30800 PE=3 SV=1 [Streptomyces alboniger]
MPKAPADPALPRQERGARPARALPYAPLVDGAADVAAGKFTLTFGGGDKAGVCSALRCRATAPTGPWTSPAEAAERYDTWNSAYSNGSYDLSVFGPNGFLRTFKGPNKKAGPWSPTTTTARRATSS